MGDKELPLTGGNITPVVRVGDTVRRATGPWTPAVHRLLRHLEAVGFDGVPRVLGIDAQGREVLTYIEGEAGYFDPFTTVPTHMWSDEVLTDAAHLLRRLHEATLSFVAPEGAKWQLPYTGHGPHEVICHNDFAPYNCVFTDGRLHAIIDFDMAAPGPRVWDIAYAAYRFVPLYDEERWSLSDQCRRLRVFCDAYGLEDRAGLTKTIERRVQAVGALILDRAARGDPVFQRHLEEGHVEVYERDLAFLQRHRHELQRSVEAHAR